MTDSSTSSNHSDHTIRLAMLGMIEGNGHPWSWSAIINGYDPEVMAAKCTYPGIIEYLGKQPLDAVGVSGATVTHLWTDNASEAPPIAEADFIDHVVDHPEDVIGKVDAVIISTDDGSDHVRRARAFVEAGLPVFVDKPLADNIGDLAWFLAARCRGSRILSSSAMRYSVEILNFRERMGPLGALRWVSSFTAKTWEKYGIHALEAAYAITGPGYSWVQTAAMENGDIVTAGHENGLTVTLPAVHDATGSFGAIQVCGTEGNESLQFSDAYAAFRAQLVAFINALQTGRDSHPFSETVEQMLVIIAGLRSRATRGQRVVIADLRGELISRVREINDSEGLDPETFLAQG